MRWIDQICASLENHQAICLAVVSRVKGSTPRELGASMLITPNGFEGSIGGGMLEHDALYQAKMALSQGDHPTRFWRDYPLGPTLGQCCGGFVSVMFEQILQSDRQYWLELAGYQSGFVIHPDDATQPAYWTDNATDHAMKHHGLMQPLMPETIPFYLYGAGHVGRAVMDVTAGLPLARHWVDTNQDRFPQQIGADITIISANDLAQIASYAPQGAVHLIMSYSHQMDFDICAALLKTDKAAKIGLIGSATKRARFKSRLMDLGFDETAIARIQCPVGLPEIGGKEPFRVALSIAGQLSEWTRKDAAASSRPPAQLIELNRQQT